MALPVRDEPIREIRIVNLKILNFLNTHDRVAVTTQHEGDHLFALMNLAQVCVLSRKLPWQLQCIAFCKETTLDWLPDRCTWWPLNTKVYKGGIV